MDIIEIILCLFIGAVIGFAFGISVSAKEEGWKREAMVDGAKMAIKRINADHKRERDRLIMKIKQLTQ